MFSIYQNYWFNPIPTNWTDLVSGFFFESFCATTAKTHVAAWVENWVFFVCQTNDTFLILVDCFDLFLINVKNFYLTFSKAWTFRTIWKFFSLLQLLFNLESKKTRIYAHEKNSKKRSAWNKKSLFLRHSLLIYLLLPISKSNINQNININSSDYRNVIYSNA